MSKSLVFLLLLVSFVGCSSLSAIKVGLIAGMVDGKLQTTMVDSDDDDIACVYGMSFDEHDDAILALTFGTKPLTTCYIGQREWRDIFKGGYSSSGILDKWLKLGLDPAGRPVKVVRLFKRVENFPNFYKLARVINVSSTNPHAKYEREALIASSGTVHHAVEPTMTDAEVAAVPDSVAAHSVSGAAAPGVHYHGSEHGALGGWGWANWPGSYAAYGASGAPLHSGVPPYFFTQLWADVHHRHHHGHHSTVVVEEPPASSSVPEGFSAVAWSPDFPNPHFLTPVDHAQVSEGATPASISSSSSSSRVTEDLMRNGWDQLSSDLGRERGRLRDGMRVTGATFTPDGRIMVVLPDGRVVLDQASISGPSSSFSSSSSSAPSSSEADEPDEESGMRRP